MFSRQIFLPTNSPNYTNIIIITENRVANNLRQKYHHRLLCVWQIPAKPIDYCDPSVNNYPSCKNTKYIRRKEERTSG